MKRGSPNSDAAAEGVGHSNIFSKFEQPIKCAHELPQAIEHKLFWALFGESRTYWVAFWWQA